MFGIVTSACIGGLVVFFVAIACFFEFAGIADFDVSGCTDALTRSPDPICVEVAGASVVGAVIDFFDGVAGFLFDAGVV